MKRISEGKISVFSRSELLSKYVFGKKEFYYQMTYYVKKGDGPMTPLDIVGLSKMLEGDAEAVNQLISLEDKDPRRINLNEALIKVVKFYNNHSNV